MNILRLIYKYLRFWGGKYECAICGKKIRSFFPFSTEILHKAKVNGFMYDFRRMETLNFDQCNCPFCLSGDRERLYMIFLNDYFRKNKEPRILDFAPNKTFAFAIKNKEGIKYTTADFFRTDMDMKLDICDMKEIRDSSFDVVICSHILEHVPDPDKAMREIKRILQSSGIAIIMVPLFWDVVHTIEDASHTTESQRLQFYGQEDHVRLFSKEDFVDRLKRSGFKVNELKTSDFDPTAIRKNAISDNSILYMCEKPEAQVV